MRLRALLGARWHVLRGALWRLLQAVVAAGIAWRLARLIPHHPRPFFAPIAALVAMAAVPGTRGRQALELIAGVTIGIGAAALVVLAAGPGTWQLMAAAFLAMLAATTAFSGRPVITTQAGASAVLVVALHQPGAAPGRLIDALIGGGVAIAIAQILLPIDPLELVSDAARAARELLARGLDELAEALRERRFEQARRALSLLESVDDRRLADALAVARGVTRRAPRRRWERRSIEAYETVARELDRAQADAHALATGALRALREAETPPPAAAAEAVEALADALRASSAAAAAEATSRARDAARRALAADAGLGIGVLAHAADDLADHIDRAFAASADATSRRNLARRWAVVRGKQRVRRGR